MISLANSLGKLANYSLKFISLSPNTYNINYFIFDMKITLYFLLFFIP